MRDPNGHEDDCAALKYEGNECTCSGARTLVTLLVIAQDAARYQWLRRFDHFARVDAMLDTTEWNTLDAAVDACMGADDA